MIERVAFLLLRRVMSSKSVIQRSSEIVAGTPVFADTRVPVETLFDYLEAGDSLDRFLDEFPTVNRSQAQEVLELSKEALIGRRDETAR